ncbi:ATPase AAA [Planobispora rosea]|uniref:ATPase AAA n=1 Tax=Planobispora rosea TaxID=35762 RepID=A0A8J3S118_PLARO|nr:ATP-binding protein [Planobispora rosea]GGS65500.1 ATPase AAA [Planobispora rosea]GIH84915.1 ATPase AAA [Planobispora rosea]
MASQRFVGRAAELEALEHWWESPFPRPGLVWGRRRVGKTALIEHFAAGRRVVFHTAARRPVLDELAELSNRMAATVSISGRDLRTRPYERWEDLLEELALAARDEPLLLVLDEFPELIAISPALPGILRAFLDRSRGKTQLRILICGSSVRTMEAIQDYREPLYGRFDLTLLLHPFRPHEAAAMLPGLRPAERALVYGIVGGMPQYLEWWDQDASVTDNLRRLACRPGSILLTEGDRVVNSEAEAGSLPAVVLFAIASGKTKHQEIADAIKTEPSRTLDRLIQMRLVERQIPVTEDPRRSRKRIYRIADNFLAFYLGVLESYRAEIERGLGPAIVGEIVSDLDDHMGAVYEEAFREHLRRLAVAGRLGPSVVAVGPWWRTDGQDQIDAVVIGRRNRTKVPVMVGESKWAREVDAARLCRKLAAKTTELTAAPDDLTYAVCARESIVNASPEILTVTATDIFASDLT